MSAPTPTQLEDAIQAAIVAASGLPARAVIWKHQDGQAPDEDYLALSIGPTSIRGRDDLEYHTNLARPAGTEIEIRASGVREFTLSVEAFCAAVVGATSGRAVLDKVRTRLALPSARDLLAAVGCSPFDPGPVRVIPDIYGTAFRGRALLEVRCYVRAEESDFVGYIAKVEITDLDSGETFLVDSGP